MAEAQKPRVNRPATTAAILAAVMVAAPLVQKWEGYRPDTYRDPIGIPTVCWGHTGTDVKLGQRHTREQCEQILNDDLVTHAEGVAACAPSIVNKPYLFASSISLAVNIGVRKFCASTARTRFERGDYRGGCEAQAWWVQAGGKTLPGLTSRRKDERLNYCLKDAA